MSKMIVNWTNEKTEKFQKDLLRFEHRLTSTGLFTDEALSEMLDNHPSDQLDVCTMAGDDHPVYPNRMRTGDFRDVSGKEILAAAKAGNIWVNVRKAMNIHPEYKKILDEMYGQLSEASGRKIYNANGGILLSSPIAKVPYHFDKTETILWHVRGNKTLFLYPMTEEFIPDAAHEAALTNYLEEDLPYDRRFEDHVKRVDLSEGEAASWPLNSPHRVANQTFCVSVTTEYSTRESGMKNAIMVTNSILRNKLGMSPEYAKETPVSRQVKSVFGRAIRKTGLLPDTSPPDMVTFKVDPSVPGYVKDVQPFEREF